MHSDNLYRSVVAVIVTMLLLSAVVYFTLGPLSANARKEEDSNEQVRTIGKILQESRVLPGHHN